MPGYSPKGASGSRMWGRISPSSTISASAGTSSGTVSQRTSCSGAPSIAPAMANSSASSGLKLRQPRCTAGWWPMNTAMGVGRPAFSFFFQM